jgi:hypothetical protein
MQECYIVGHNQVFGGMPTGLIKYQYHMGIFTCLLAYESKMMVHVIGVYRRSYQCGGVAGERVNCSE